MESIPIPVWLELDSRPPCYQKGSSFREVLAGGKLRRHGVVEKFIENVNGIIYYSVSFSDGSFDTYFCQNSMY